MTIAQYTSNLLCFTVFIYVLKVLIISTSFFVFVFFCCFFSFILLSDLGHMLLSFQFLGGPKCDVGGKRSIAFGGTVVRPNLVQKLLSFQFTARATVQGPPCVFWWRETVKSEQGFSLINSERNSHFLWGNWGKHTSSGAHFFTLISGLILC